MGGSTLLLGLAPHGVYPAFDVTTEAVSSYLAISPLPLSEIISESGGIVSAALSIGSPGISAVVAVRLLTGMLFCGVRTFLKEAVACVPSA